MKAGLKALISTAKSVRIRHRGFRGLIRHVHEILSDEGVKGVRSRLSVLLILSGKMERDKHDCKGAINANVPGIGADRNDAEIAEFRLNRRSRPFSRPEISPELLPGATLVGHPYAILGMGEVIRSAANAMETTGIPFCIRNTFGDYGIQDRDKHKDFPLMDRITSAAVYKTNIFYLNADEMQSALTHLGPEFFRGKYNIGCWAWELSKFPEEWCSAFGLVDEIWALSRFTQQAISEKADCPVLWMPLAVELQGAVRLSREYFGLPQNKFLFLFFFDFRSYISRKNPTAVMKAFQKAFGRTSSQDVCLVVKVNGKEGHWKEYAAFQDAIDAFGANAILIDKVMDDREIRELLRVCDAFVSLHRSEGFGRGLAEAMYLGKPVIATGYSGNLDFNNEMNACLVDHVLVPVKEGEYPYGTGQFWADPDIEQAAWYMRRLARDLSYARQLGRTGENYIKTYHSFRSIGARMRKRLEKLKLV